MEFSTEFIKILDYLCEKFGVVIDWSSDNIWPYIETLCNKYINWNIATSIMWIIVGIAFFIIAFFLYVKGNAAVYEDDWACYMVGVGLSAIIGAAIVSKQVYDIITCIYFPEILIFEQLQTLAYGFGK